MTRRGGGPLRCAMPGRSSSVLCAGPLGDSCRGLQSRKADRRLRLSQQRAVGAILPAGVHVVDTEAALAEVAPYVVTLAQAEDLQPTVRP